MFELLAEPAFWASIVVLVGMELALGIDNIVFISVLVSTVPEEHRERVRQIGMVLAAVFRLLLLFAVAWILGLQRSAFTLGGWSPSWRELVFIAGGAFLIYKAVSELHALVELRGAPAPVKPVAEGTSGVFVAIVQIAVINAVFSVDSIVTAIGVSPYIESMAVAVVISVFLLYVASGPISDLLSRHPSVKALALGFLLLVGGLLIAEGFGMPVEQPYFYIGFAIAAASLAILKLVRRPKTPVIAEAPAAEKIEPVIPEPEMEAEPVVETEAVVEPEVAAPDTEDISPEAEAAHVSEVASVPVKAPRRRRPRNTNKKKDIDT